LLLRRTKRGNEYLNALGLFKKNGIREVSDIVVQDLLGAGNFGKITSESPIQYHGISFRY
jgi:hypothetical protein